MLLRILPKVSLIGAFRIQALAMETWEAHRGPPNRQGFLLKHPVQINFHKFITKSLPIQRLME